MGTLREMIPITFQALVAVFGVVFVGSAIVVALVTVLAQTPAGTSRSEILSFYTVAAALNGASAAVGSLPAYILLRWRPSELSDRRRLLWSVVSGSVSMLSLNLGITTALVGDFFGKHLPPAHYGMSDLFVSVAAVSLAVTLVLKGVDTVIRAKEIQGSSENA